jgi:hypothetical protein
MAEKINTIERFELFTVNEKEYKLQFTIKSLIMMEKELNAKSLLDTLASPPFTFGDTFTMFKWGLIGGNNKLAEEKTEELMLNYTEEFSFADLQGLIISALAKSGAIGRPDKKRKN